MKANMKKGIKDLLFEGFTFSIIISLLMVSPLGDDYQYTSLHAALGGAWLPPPIGFVNTISRREELSDLHLKPRCYAAVAIVILEAILARAHGVFVHFAGIELSGPTATFQRRCNFWSSPS
jgi:hypothetical protein